MYNLGDQQSAYRVILNIMIYRILISVKYFDVSTWIAIVAAGAAIVAAIAAFLQARGLKLSIKADTLLKFIDRFDSTNFKMARRTATLACHTNLKNKNPGVDVDDVLDFFEDIAFMVNKQALDQEMAWHAFFHWMRLYYQASEKYIDERRQEEPTVWKYFIGLYHKLVALEKINSHGKYKERLDDSEIKKELEDELSSLETMS